MKKDGVEYVASEGGEKICGDGFTGASNRVARPLPIVQPCICNRLYLKPLQRIAKK